ncbi:unnamed protein product [Ciceribacter selenitireducens ATCC BAA-1503]|uniref:Uncharacterized protein n=1 Tax=Ciceribacter selenitireducens ATCC BAA-1503 TaxID=1336235 RepID=A0A376ADM6_9HYPH|nr:unnamed protein product [Ciceribacter selenitireducens ATCC BAA-1503]
MYVFRFLLFVIAMGILTPRLFAADISTAVVSGQNFITITGDLVDGDDWKFKNIAIALDRAVVLLDSRGGLSAVGIEIGRTVSIKGFLTAVGTKGVCASSCGLIWLAGRERFLYPNSRIGFHAIYTTPDGKPAISSDGNALVGAYLRQLGFSDRVVVYVTQSAPTSMQWLTMEDALLLGLHATLVEVASPSTSAQSGARDVGTKDASLPPTRLPLPKPRPVEERVFLYEERNGLQPTVSVGTVAWSIGQQESPTKGLQQRIIGSIKVPSKRLELELMIAPNNESSLPASHLIRFLFSYPLDLDNDPAQVVERIALKRTEPDRGSALIGVPARLSDDTFVYALNDFDDAVRQNLSLLKTRGWMDIPIALRSGQRVLLTVEKGDTGSLVFERVIDSWKR